MKRRDFMKLCGSLGVGIATPACGRQIPATERMGLSVIVVGAGVAGMSAAHLLTQRGVEVRVLEAAPVHGGRVKRTKDFVDFSIPLGAEWLHASRSTLARIVNDETIELTTTLASYSPDDLVGYFDGELQLETMSNSTDLKFVGATWLDFFDEYIVPGIADQMTFDTQVVAIDRSGDRVTVTDANGVAREADAVIVTVPLVMLRDRAIEFIPALSSDKQTALQDADVWTGIKVFMEFEERFYPTFIEFSDSETDAGQRVYYDAAYAQETDANVLGLFAVGRQAWPYQDRQGTDLRDYVLSELDEIFDGAASDSYVQHLAQNWAEEPFIRQAYLADGADQRGVQLLGQPDGDRTFFAGEAYTNGEDWGSVHAATRSARTAVEGLLQRR